LLLCELCVLCGYCASGKILHKAHRAQRSQSPRHGLCAILSARAVKSFLTTKSTRDTKGVEGKASAFHPLRVYGSMLAAHGAFGYNTGSFPVHSTILFHFGFYTAASTSCGNDAMSAGISLHDLQALIRTMYYDKDAGRGAEATFLWFVEEVGELAAAVRNGTCEELHEEFADVLAWLVTLANIKGVDLSHAVSEKYGTGCPGCGTLICQCPDSEKP